MHCETLKREHLQQIDPAGGLDVITETAFSTLCNGIDGVIGFTLVHNNRIIAIGGIYELWKGVGEAFAIMGEGAFLYPKSLFATFSRNLETGIKIGNYRRIQATIKEGFDAGIRFIEHLKFKSEGLLEKWGPDGNNYYMYARIIWP